MSTSRAVVSVSSPVTGGLSRRDLLFPSLRRRWGSQESDTGARAALVQPVADQVAWAVLRQAVGSMGTILEDRIGGSSAFGSAGAAEAVVVGEREGLERLFELSLANGFAHRFWCGQTREAQMVLQGHIRLAGTTAACFDFLRVLPWISRSYRHEAGIRLDASPRLNVLKHLRVSADTVSAFGLGLQMDTADDGDRVAFVAALVLGLHPLCRTIELRGIASACSRNEIPLQHVAAVAQTVGRFEIRDRRLAAPAVAA